MTHPSPTRLSADLVEVFGNAENFLRVGKPDENFFVLPQPLVGFDEGDKFAKDLRDIGPIDLVDDHDKLLRLAAHVTVTGEQGSQRSEEHTSELQSLMRTSYAVFCLKKKTTQ